MSQRQGPPQSWWSRAFLKCMACLMCEPEYHEWQAVWNGRDELHHGDAPVAEGGYRGHTCKWNLAHNGLQLVVSPGGQAHNV